MLEKIVKVGEIVPLRVNRARSIITFCNRRSFELLVSFLERLRDRMGLDLAIARPT